MELNVECTLGVVQLKGGGKDKELGGDGATCRLRARGSSVKGRNRTEPHFDFVLNRHPTE